MRILNRLLACLVLAIVAGFTTGCPPPPPPPPPKTGYIGPTDSMTQVAAAINARNQALPTLWAKHYYEATIIDDKKQPHFVNGDGALLFRRPGEILIAGTKPAIGRVFEIGSTQDRYWLKVVPEMDTMWWGKQEHVGKPCVRPVPISASGIIEVLGVSTFNTDFSALPAPVMRFNNDADAYMFVWVTRLADRFVATREVWFDRKTLLPKLVILFDENGRVQLRAILENHVPVEVPDVPQAKWPVVATNYKLLFPENGTKMSFTLSDLTLDRNGVPARRGISFPDLEQPGVAKVIQLDEECDRQGR